MIPTVCSAAGSAPTPAQSVPDPTWVGAVRRVVSPTPSSPTTFQPQAQSVPSALTATVWNAPGATFDQLLVPTCTGAVRIAVSPRPN